MSSSLVSQGSRVGYAPEGDVHVEYAMRRLQKMQRQPTQEPNRVTPPPKPTPSKAY